MPIHALTCCSRALSKACILTVANIRPEEIVFFESGVESYQAAMIYCLLLVNSGVAKGGGWRAVRPGRHVPGAAF